MELSNQPLDPSVRYFQRLGWPQGTNAGRGGRVRYDARQTLQMCCGFELLQLGLSPERVVRFMVRMEVMFAQAFHKAALGEIIFVMFDPAILSSLAWGGDIEKNDQFCWLIDSDRLTQRFKQYDSLAQKRRLAWINVSVLLARVLAALGEDAPKEAELICELSAWASEPALQIA